MRAAVRRVDVVRKGEQQLGVAVVVLQRHLGGVVPLPRREVDDLVVQGLDALLLVDVLDEAADAALVVEVLLHRLGPPLVAQDDVDPRVEERLLAQPAQQGVVVVEDLLKDLRVGPEGDLGALLVGVAGDCERRALLATLEPLVVAVLAVAHLDLEPLGQGVDDRGAHAVQAARHLVAAAAELAARVQDGEDDGDGGKAGLALGADGDAAAVVRDLDDLAGKQVHLDHRAIARERLVDRVVDNLIDQVVQAARPRRPDIHAGPLAYRLQPLEHLDLRGVVICFLGRDSRRVVVHCIQL